MRRTKITIGGKTLSVRRDGRQRSRCVVKALPLYPYQNVSMAVTNGYGSAETIQSQCRHGDAARLRVVVRRSGSARRRARSRVARRPLRCRNANEVILFYKREDGRLRRAGACTCSRRIRRRRLDQLGRSLARGRRSAVRRVLPHHAAAEREPGYSNNPAAHRRRSRPCSASSSTRATMKDPGPDQRSGSREDGNMVSSSPA